MCQCGWTDRGIYRHFFVAAVSDHSAKQHPVGVRQLTNFYIILMSDGKLYGPMAREEGYKQKKNELYTGDLDFKLVFSDLE